MKLNEYQNEAMKFAKHEYSDHAFFKLMGEVGEVMDKLGKFSRENDYYPISDIIFDASNSSSNDFVILREELKKDLGGVLCQLQACCNALGLNLEDVAVSNLEKLNSKKTSED